MRKLLILSAILVVSTALPARAGVGWLNKCGYDHSLPDDPIVYPGQPGASHLHDFFGATDTNAYSTFDSMRAGGTTCQADDTAGYWTPALYDNGNRVLPAGWFDGRETRQQFYYRDDNLARGTHVSAFPVGFQMVAGNSHATSVADNPELGDQIYWGCADNQDIGGKQTEAGSCSVGIITLHVGFPNCWDGEHVDTVTNPGSVVYPSDGTCPASNPVALPRLVERFEYPVGTTTGTITLSSGPSYTAHADFWNTWNQATLLTRVNDCLNADVNCGEFEG